jgi:hypothetical protein
MFGKQGKPAKANVGSPIMGKKPAGKGVGLGQNAKPAALKTVKGNKNKLK